MEYWFKGGSICDFIWTMGINTGYYIPWWCNADSSYKVLCRLCLFWNACRFFFSKLGFIWITEDFFGNRYGCFFVIYSFNLFLNSIYRIWMFRSFYFNNSKSFYFWSLILYCISWVLGFFYIYWNFWRLPDTLLFTFCFFFKTTIWCFLQLFSCSSTNLCVIILLT